MRRISRLYAHALCGSDVGSQHTPATDVVRPQRVHERVAAGNLAAHGGHRPRHAVWSERRLGPAGRLRHAVLQRRHGRRVGRVRLCMQHLLRHCPSARRRHRDGPRGALWRTLRIHATCVRTNAGTRCVRTHARPAARTPATHATSSRLQVAPAAASIAAGRRARGVMLRRVPIMMKFALFDTSTSRALLAARTASASVRHMDAAQHVTNDRLEARLGGRMVNQLAVAQRANASTTCVAVIAHLSRHCHSRVPAVLRVPTERAG